LITSSFQKQNNDTATAAINNLESKLNSSKFGNKIGHNDQQHSALMSEFKKAHKRMFNKSLNDSTEGDAVSNCWSLSAIIKASHSATHQIT
jgi:t-SNARE complex subunit (syntaxin)